ncbi:MAG: class I adenylate-forming enzyme family protein [Enterobacterales bacterium]|nr:class I adenylate-forming enzyme family protein [Enterobacterales bacterium]
MNSQKRVKFKNVNQAIDYFADKTPQSVAMLQHEDQRQISYKKFATLIDLFALRLIDAGLKKGDRVATQLVLVPEHVILMYACFKIGVIIAPLDLRLKPMEVVRDINKIQPTMFFFLGKTTVTDFREVAKAVQRECKSVKHFIQFANKKDKNIVSHAVSISQFMNKIRLFYLKIKNSLCSDLKKAARDLNPRTAALIIYTTGTTGAPKPALLCHENILVQNEILSRGIGELKQPLCTMVNLPPSHVGCVTETLMTTFYRGGKAILLRIFDVELTLDAIEKHRINLLGQIPTQFRMLWAHPKYNQFDLSSLESVIYAGSAGDLPFLKRLSAMAPSIGTGLGMTENAGFATFSQLGSSAESLVGQVGSSFPDLAKVTIRQAMQDDGHAGEELGLGETGEICYHPPIVFLGYFNQPEETQNAISLEGILYTGDIGYFKQLDNATVLFLSGRKKFVIKQKGYNVFPTEVEEHIVALKGIEQVEVVGIKHQLFDEAIFGFVLLSENSNLSVESIVQHCQLIAAYKRPQHIEIWPSDKPLPLTRSSKVDKIALQKIALAKVDDLRNKGAWDA